MDLVYDFIPPNLNPHLDVESILLMRMTSKKFNCYKIQKNHNYIRNIKNTWGIFNYIDNEKDIYKISLYLEENFISDTIIKKLNYLFSKKNIYSIRILNNPVINYQSYSISNNNIYINLNNNLLEILEGCKNIQDLKYISLNFIYFWKFSKQRENIILKKHFGKNFDTFHINFNEFEIKDLKCILPYLNRSNYPTLKNLIIDNLLINSNDFRSIVQHHSINQHIYIGESRNIESNELHYCHDFVYNSDYQLKKTEFILIDSQKSVIFVYHYNRDYDYNFTSNLYNYNVNILDSFI